MFAYLKGLFEPPSQQKIKAATNQRLYNARVKNRMRMRNGPTRRVNLRNMKLNAQKMTNRDLDELLKKNDLSTNASPRYEVNKNGKRVTFTVPFSTPNKFTTAMVYLNSMKNEKENRGTFKNIDINVRKSNNSNSTLTFTLSSSKNMTVPIPHYFVQKIFGVHVPLVRKSKITKEDLINWSKYRKRGTKIKYVKDFIKADEFFEGKLQKKIYGQSGLWDQHGLHIAKHVEEMRRVMDPKNITKVLGKKPEQEDALEIVLISAMKKYMQLEGKVYTEKARRLNVRALYKNYIIENNKKLVERQEHLPKFCNIPYDWRVHLVHHTMKEDETTDDSGTWTAFKKYVATNPQFQLNFASGNTILLRAMGKYYSTIETKKRDLMNVNVNVNRMNEQILYNKLLREYRPFLRHSFHTIGSIRYPHSSAVQCPLTKRDDVWEYKFTKKTKRNNITVGDSWIQILSEREGFDEDLKNAHVVIDDTLNKLVDYYKVKVLREIARQQANTDAQIKKVDIDLAWKLYSICNKSEMHKHPMFRVCAGFRALNASNPDKSKFMDRFRYMVHNRPEEHYRSEPKEGQMADVEFVLTQSDVKYFFLSSDIYQSNPKYMIKKNQPADINAFNAHNCTKNTNGKIVQQVGCGALLKKETMFLLEENNKAQSGDVFLAWPTLRDASNYYSNT